MSDIKPTHNVPEFSVSEVSNALKRVVESNFSYVRVRGEISGLKIAASGHVYLSLKDDKSVLSGICWKGVAGRLRFKPEDGLEVIATGKLTTYAGRSNYQIVIESMEVAGEGALMALLEKRKKQLTAEGLFDADKKQSLPYLPQTIGVITSPTGAVIRDILHRLQDRMPCNVLVWPVLVQGDGAAEQISKAIAGFNDLNQPDLLIVARGGGSIEDLWPFNEEEVVRAVAASNIPVISAVGHETDTTLIDYVSDQRAPTPTAAAEMAVPVRADLLYTLRDHQQRMDSLLQTRLQQYRQQIEGLARGLPKPAEIMANARQSLDILSDKLRQSLQMMVTAKSHQLQQTTSGLRPGLLEQPLKEQARQLSDINEKMSDRFSRIIERKQTQLEHMSSKLSLLDYNNILKRGFALVKNDAGDLITSAKHANKATTLTFHDGDAKIGGAHIPVKRKPKKPKLVKTDELQESLF